MTGISGSELLIVLAVAYLVLGPRDAAGALRAVGRIMARARRYVFEVQRQLDAALREAEPRGGRGPGHPPARQSAGPLARTPGPAAEPDA